MRSFLISGDLLERATALDIMNGASEMSCSKRLTPLSTLKLCRAMIVNLCAQKGHSRALLIKFVINLVLSFVLLPICAGNLLELGRFWWL